MLIPGLAPMHVVVVEATPAMWDMSPTAGEAECVKNAVPKRRREFAAGRACSRAALARLGVHNFDLLPGPSRAPAWPAGIVGSITHCENYCAAAVAHARHVAALGIDAEPAQPLPTELVREICTRREQATIRELGEGPIAAIWARLIFSAKEAFYKAWFPRYEQFLEFHDVEVTLDPIASRFHLTRVATEAPLFEGSRRCSGSFFQASSLMGCLIAVPAAHAGRE